MKVKLLCNQKVLSFDATHFDRVMTNFGPMSFHKGKDYSARLCVHRWVE